MADSVQRMNQYDCDIWISTSRVAHFTVPCFMIKAPNRSKAIVDLIMIQIFYFSNVHDSVIM